MFPHSLPNNIYLNKITQHLFLIMKLTVDFIGLKVISLNCQSIQLQSTARRARLRAPVYEHSPDIIIGCESQIDNS